MPIVQTYYPFISENDMKMMLETENNTFLLRFQNLGSQITDMEIPVYLSQDQVALIGSMSGTVAHPTGRLIWTLQTTAVIREGTIISTAGNRGHFVHQITRNGVNYSNVQVRRISSDLCTTQQRSNNPVMMREVQRTTVTHQYFVAEIRRIRSAFASQALGHIAIVVAIGTGVAMSLGMGPAAGVSGLGSNIGSRVGTAIISGMASAFTQFLRGCFEEMTRITHDRTRQTAHLQATRFWANNQRRMRLIVAQSINNGVFSAGTSFIPGPTINEMSDFSVGALAGLILNRLSNNFINAIQTAYEAVLSGTRPDWSQIRTNFITDCTVRRLC